MGRGSRALLWVGRCGAHGALGALAALGACGRIDFTDLSASDARAIGSDGAPGIDAVPAAPPQLIQSGDVEASSVASLATTLSAPTTAGNLILVATIMDVNLQVKTITDDAGDTFVSANVPAAWTVGASTTELWYAANGRGGATTITVTSPSASDIDTWVLEVAGVSTTAPLDRAAALNDGPDTGTPTAPQVTPTSLPSFVVSVAVVTNGVSGLHAGSPWSSLPLHMGNDVAYVIATTSTPPAAEWDDPTPGTFGASTAAFRAGP